MYYSISSLGKHSECPQLFDYLYHHGLEPHDSGSFEATYGRAFHHCVEHGDLDTGEYFGQDWSEVVWAHYECYQNHWAADRLWGFDVLQHEVQFDWSPSPGYDLRGYIDRVVEHNGEVYLAETKTTGAKDLREFVDKKAKTLQPMVYLSAAREVLNCPRPAGIIYDVSRRPSIRRKKGEPNSSYVARVEDWYFKERPFHRQLVTYSEDELHEAVADVTTQIDVIREKKVYKNRNSCYNWRRQCGFYPVCFGGEKLTNSELYKVRNRR